MSNANATQLKLNGVYMFRNLASGKYLNIYGNDQVSSNRNVCQWEASADLSQLWRFYEDENLSKKLISVIKGSSGQLYGLNIYRSIHKNTDIYVETPTNIVDSSIDIECLGPISGANFSGEKVRIHLHFAESDGSYLYLTSVGNGNGSSATTSTSDGNVIWKTGDEADAHQLWVAEFFADYPTGNFDLRKFGAQIFLNKMYGSDIPVDAKASTRLCQELIRALQIELGITLGENESYGNFGPKTENLCPTLYKGCTVKPEIVKILCHALFCKGYSTSVIYDTFNDKVEAGVKALQNDIGLSQTGRVAPKLFKAILNTDAYQLVDGGDPHVFTMQQNLNHDYWEYSGIYSCDGRFSRDTNKAIIYALQKEIGIAAENATGTFGPSTTALCPTLPLADPSTLNEQNLVKILQYGLYANGYNQSGIFDGAFSDAVLTDVQAFQQFMMYTVKNVADMGTIKGLLASCGDTNRIVTGCDTATILNASSAGTLYSAGYRYVGRYLTGTVRTPSGQRVPKALTRTEAETILNAGLNIVPIYQDGGSYATYFHRQRGAIDAGAAISAALALGLPSDSIIYFAVDCDLYAYQVESIVADYFSGIADYFAMFNTNPESVSYKIGVYGPRYTCTYICSNNYAESCYVSDMSTAYSGNLGYKMPTNWAFDQFFETSVGGVGIDKVAVSGRYTGVSMLNPGSSIMTEEQKMAAILHKVCDFQEDIELLRAVSVPTIVLGVPVVIFKIPSLEAKLTVSESVYQGDYPPIFSFSVANGNLSTASKTEFDNGFSSAISADTSIAELLKDVDPEKAWNIIKGMGVSIQNGNIKISYSVSPKSFTLTISASTETFPLPMDNHCAFSLALSVTITLDEDGGIADPGGQLAEFWETLKDTAVNMVFLAAAGATVAAIILLLLKAPAIAPEILPLLPTLMNLLRVKIA